MGARGENSPGLLFTTSVLSQVPNAEEQSHACTRGAQGLAGASRDPHPAPAGTGGDAGLGTVLARGKPRCVFTCAHLPAPPLPARTRSPPGAGMRCGTVPGLREPGRVWPPLLASEGQGRGSRLFSSSCLQKENKPQDLQETPPGRSFPLGSSLLPAHLLRLPPFTWDLGRAQLAACAFHSHTSANNPTSDPSLLMGDKKHLNKFPALRPRFVEQP